MVEARKAGMHFPQVERLTPLRKKRNATPQCSVMMDRKPGVPSLYWQLRRERDLARGFDANQCAMASHWVIEGRHFCDRHAGQAALQILTQSQSTKDIASSVVDLLRQHDARRPVTPLSADPL